MSFIPVSIVRAHIQQLTTLALAESTQKLYVRGWTMFLGFAQQYHVDLNSIKEYNLLEFISFLSLSGFVASMVQLYLAGVRHHLKLRGQNSFNNSFIIRMVVKGVSTRFPEQDVRLPITLDLLADMWDVLPYIVHDQFQITMFHCMLTLGYHALLRPGELTYSPHTVQVEKVYFVQQQVHIYLTSSKMHKEPFPQQVIVTSQPSRCPIQDLCNYLQVWPWVLGALFRKESGLPVHYHELHNIISRLANFLNLPQDHYKPHSLRIGATTDLHLRGYTNEAIKKKGRWSSAAFYRYIHI